MKNDQNKNCLKRLTGPKKTVTSKFCFREQQNKTILSLTNKICHSFIIYIFLCLELSILTLTAKLHSIMSQMF